MTPLARGALAGAAGATVWTISEPLLRRAFGTPYSDVRLAGRLLTSGRLWPLAGVVAHTALGVGLGSALTAAGLTTPLRAVLGSQAENLAAWPGMALADRFHPDRRDGDWPRLLTNHRVFAQSAAARLLFGVGFAQSSRVLARRG
jgi:hypothetical protein